MMPIPESMLIDGMIKQGFEEKDARATYLFTPLIVQKRAEALLQNQRFVHYTSAEAVIKIAESNSIWLRNARLMNDWSEVSHGIQAVTAFLHSKAGLEFQKELDFAHDGSSNRIFQQYSSWSNDILITHYPQQASAGGRAPVGCGPRPIRDAG